MSSMENYNTQEKKMDKEKRGLIQTMLDYAMKEDVKYGPKGKPRKSGLSKTWGRSKSKQDDIQALADAGLDFED